MHTLLLIAHGSRRQQSNEEVKQLADRIAKEDGHGFDQVAHAFLEIAYPSISEAITQCVKLGSSEITVFPYFLSAGRHVAEDIPHDVKSAAAAYPSLKVTIKPHLGSSINMAKEIIGLASE